MIFFSVAILFLALFACCAHMADREIAQWCDTDIHGSDDAA